MVVARRSVGFASEVASAERSAAVMRLGMSSTPVSQSLARISGVTSMTAQEAAERFTFVDPETVIGRVRAEDERTLAAFAIALRARRGEWAQWPLPASGAHVRNMATRIRKHADAAPKMFRHGFDAAVRDGVMYVRFVGEGF